MDQVQEELRQFKKDTAYYEAHYEELLKKYPEQWVAIFEQQVVGASPDYEKLLDALHAKGYSVGRILVERLATQDELLIL